MQSSQVQSSQDASSIITGCFSATITGAIITGCFSLSGSASCETEKEASCEKEASREGLQVSASIAGVQGVLQNTPHTLHSNPSLLFTSGLKAMFHQHHLLKQKIANTTVLNLMTSNEQQSPIAGPTPIATAAAVVCVCVCVHSKPQESQHVCSTRVRSFAPFRDLAPFLEQAADILVQCGPQGDNLCADVRGHLRHSTLQNFATPQPLSVANKCTSAFAHKHSTSASSNGAT